VGSRTWVAFLESRETGTTQHGVYPALLFRQDMSAVYLTLAQDVTQPKKKLGAAEAVAYLQGIARRVRDLCPDLAEARLALDGSVDLRADPGIGRDYETSVIAHQLYGAEAVLRDREIIEDLEAVRDATDRYIASKSQGGEDELRRLVAQFEDERPYPTESDKTHIAARAELADFLSQQNLARIQADPATSDGATFNRFAGATYGGPGSQSQVHVGLHRDGDEGRTRLARGLEHVLYGDGEQSARIDAVMSDPNWAVFGLKESLLGKALAVVYPQRWLPAFYYGGDSGKKKFAQAPELGVARSTRKCLTRQASAPSNLTGGGPRSSPRCCPTIRGDRPSSCGGCTTESRWKSVPPSGYGS
jgi:hypothetical protein